MDGKRAESYKEIESLRQSKVLVYVTGDRPGLETQIHPEVMDYFVEHLDKMSNPEKISLILYTRGGSTLAAWSIVNLIRQFADHFEVIIPSKALSAGTLISLGADNIIMTKQATLGPIDPSINTPLNPQIQGADTFARMPVSVEAINGFIELAKNEFNLSSETELSKILVSLSEKVHPLVLGEVVRARTQIKMLANRLLRRQISDEEKVSKIINFLVSDSGSHDYTINRREAKDELGLVIEKPDDVLYRHIKNIFDGIRTELLLNEKLDVAAFLGTDQQRAYSYRRSLIESLVHGTHVQVSNGILLKQGIQRENVTQTLISDQRTFEGWKYEPL